MRKTHLKNIIVAFVTSLVCTIICFTIHIIPQSNSMINFKTDSINTSKTSISNDYLSAVIVYHKTEPAFAKRPLTTFLIEGFSKITSLNLGLSFTIINFFLFFLVGILIFYGSLALGNHLKASVLSIVCFFLSFTVLFSFFRSNYSYDEPLQYFFILIALFALFYKNWFVYIFSFSFALIVRESSVFLLPSIALFLFPDKEKTESFINWKYLKRIIVLSIPVFVYLLFLFVYLTYFRIWNQSKTDISGRLSYFHYNFQDANFSNESIISLFLAVGLHFYFIFWYLKDAGLTLFERKLIKSFILTLIINSVVILLAAKAREIRLFALPLLFVWPIIGKVVLSEFKLMKTGYKNLKNLLFVPLFLFLSFISLIISNYIYTLTEPDRNENFFHEYLGITLVLISLHFLIRFLGGRRQKNSKPDAKE
ncbi:MAG TPA: hypothetical protein PKW80_09410 [Bacteroidales bacterium]|nr:hypothetical protein [Bacteroidales bacterium]